MGKPGKCAACGHDPACGFASVSDEQGERWLCHDDDHSCFAPGGAHAELERLKREGSPGVLHAVDQRFHDLVVKERDAERTMNASLRAEIERVRASYTRMCEALVEVEAERDRLRRERSDGAAAMELDLALHVKWLAESRAREARLQAALEALDKHAGMDSHEQHRRVPVICLNCGDPWPCEYAKAQRLAEAALSAPASEALDAIRRVPHLYEYGVSGQYAIGHPEGDRHEQACARLGGACALAKIFGEVKP